MVSEKMEVHLPDLGEVDAVSVIEWHKRVGEATVEGEDLVEVETDKPTFVVPSPATGRLSRICAQVSVKLEAGGLLGEIELS
jgi:pyruvate dehydrogenase E2 component (dihydrolipoamide acetyltransferase)